MIKGALIGFLLSVAVIAGISGVVLVANAAADAWGLPGIVVSAAGIFIAYCTLVGAFWDR